jgi:translation elongation factor EF-Tu-like GTPase
MAKKPLTVTNPVNIGTIGNVDHGNYINSSNHKAIVAVYCQAKPFNQMMKCSEEKKEITG